MASHSSTTFAAVVQSDRSRAPTSVHPVKKTTRPASSPLRLERHTLRNLQGGSFDATDLTDLIIPRVRPGLTLGGSSPVSISCPPTNPGG